MATDGKANPKKKGTRLLYKTDVPHEAPSWPTITPNDSQLMIEMLCRILNPIGQHRRDNPPPSKLRRKHKRKRDAPDNDPPASRSPPPEISKSIIEGLNSTTAHLERLVTQRQALSRKVNSAETDHSSTIDQLPLVFVFMASSQAIPLQFQHLPALTCLASSPKPLLIPLPANAEKLIAKALGIPRVSALGIAENAPGADTLIEFCKDKITPISIPWLEEAVAGANPTWAGTKFVVDEI